VPVFHRGAATTIAAAAVLLAGSTLGSYAANGGPLLLGKSNTASKTTTLKTTGNGAALSLKSKKNKPPLKVSSSTKVAKLNADLVDGVEADALETTSFVYSLNSPTIVEDYVKFQLPGLPAGRYQVSFSVSAAIPGTPTFFACYLVAGSAAIDAPVTGLGGNAGGVINVSSGSGYVDTLAATYRLVCQRTGGDSMTIPAATEFPSRIVLTRLDNVTSTATSGTGSTVPRGAPAGASR